MKVEELAMYGKALEMPKEGVKKQMKVVLNLLRKEFGIAGLVGIMLGVKRHSKRIRRDYPQAMEKANNMSKVLAEELSIMGGLFSAVADKRGRVYAKDFMTQMMQMVAPVSLPALYQLNDLVNCEGDVFDNFKKFNRAMFSEIDRIGTWKNSGFHETEDLLELKVTSCANVELFEAIDCPELNALGCDHDLAAYPLIENAVQCEFRRPCTLAKGGDCCHFHFYRKGTAPDNAHLNQ